MIEHNNPDRYPFKIGQLIMCVYEPGFYDGLCLVLDLRWDFRHGTWQVRYLHQRCGHTDWLRSVWFEPVGKTDD